MNLRPQVTADTADRILRPPTDHDRYFYGHGKLLISGEYFILDGAQGLALPTVMGQSMGVRHAPSFDPLLHWKSYDSEGNLWFEARFEFWHFNLVDTSVTPEALTVQDILRKARTENKHFLRDEVDVFVDTKLDFPIGWGLGSSSTLLYNIAQWAYISPFDLFFKTSKGSGYDIACTRSEMPILYQWGSGESNFSIVNFTPSFRDKLYFVYMGNKQDSDSAIEYYRSRGAPSKELVDEVTALTQKFLDAETLEDFEEGIRQHEKLVGEYLDLVPVKEQFFADYRGEIKSLGAWGGDFVLATGRGSSDETRQYFAERGFDTFLLFDEMILNQAGGFFKDHGAH